MKIRLEEYIQEDGSSPYQTWFNGLDAQAAAKITVAKARLELGNTSNVDWFRGIGEYKIDWGPGYRIYLVPDRKPLFFKKHPQPPLGTGAVNFLFRTWSERLRRRYAE